MLAKKIWELADIQVPVKLLRAIEIVVAKTQNVESIYIFGSFVDTLMRNDELTSDVDIAFIFDCDFNKTEKLLCIGDTVEKLKNIEVGFSYNGVPFSKESLVIDFVPIPASDITSNSPQLLFDLLNSNLLFIRGENRLKDKMNYHPNFEQLLERVRLTLMYIDREYEKGSDIEHWNQYFVKSVYFIGNMLTLNSQRISSIQEFKAVIDSTFTTKLPSSFISPNSAISALTLRGIYDWMRKNKSSFIDFFERELGR